MSSIRKIDCRNVLNSHVKFTNEFVIMLDNGSVGAGASPQGETISIYEDKQCPIDAQSIIQKIQADGIFGQPLDQSEFDSYLQQHIAFIGRNNAFGLSLAFYNAAVQSREPADLLGRPQAKMAPPKLCLNILNGGWHAYTNPVLSDFSEFMLVARHTNLAETIADHNEIQRVVHEKQLTQAKTVVSGNPVNSFAVRDNRAVIEFLLEICEELGLSGKYDLMIDASAGDLWNGEGYCLGITDGKVYSSEAFLDYWLDIIGKYNLRFLEDPFHEQDFASWQRLTTTQDSSIIIGDNLYSSHEDRIAEGAAKRYAGAAIIKPNQAGTVSAVCRAIETCQETGHIAITSHRSISTESAFISTLTCVFNVPYIKIGPLVTDYSSIVRLNEIIRLAGDNHAN